MIIIETCKRLEGGQFIPFGDVAEVQEDIDLVEGVLEVEIDGISLIKKSEWDYVFPLWCYLSDAVKGLRGTGFAAFQFPDQPIEVSLRRIGQDVELCVQVGKSESKAIVAELEFLAAVRARGDEFFRQSLRLSPGSRSVIDVSRRHLLQDPPGSPPEWKNWREQLDPRQVNAFSMAERSIGRKLTPPEIQGLIYKIAGRRMAFHDIVGLILQSISG
ncbi:hypothetical protein ACIRU3_24060 [Streptomyces sp. NPDC101151]|uniref:hypothetical protein n=1 Tax=Streptomyces sp. NPDC101151 TaxID=3366115 RepID=UPI00382108EF